MARLEFRLPDIGEGVAEAEIVEWHGQVGDAVKEGQTIVAVMTDKATVEMEAPADGILRDRRGETGEMIPVGTVLFVLETAEAEPARDSGVEQTSAPEERAPPETKAGPPPPQARAPRILAAPAVRQRAKVLGIDLAVVPAGGDHVRHEDLDRYLLARGGASSGPTPASGQHGEEVPLTGLRRRIARRMEEARQHIPHFTYVEELDVTALELRRAALNAEHGDRPPLHLLPFLVAAMCHALRDFPALNAHYDDAREVLTRFTAVHAGIATQTDSGLTVPVLRDAGRLDVWEIAAQITALADRARSGESTREELSGSTITITSLGKLGGIAATPIINRPEVAILAPHRVIERPVLVDGKIAPRKIMNLSISCDHRVIDGFVAASFVQAIRQELEQP